MITSKQRAYLRGLAQNLEPIFQVGKNGVNDNQVQQLIDALEAREIIKINLLNTLPDDKHSIADEIASKTGADIVQLIGKKLTIYKKSTKNPKIELPN